MRFDEASARYAEFGPFFISYIATPEDTIRHVRL
jgi:chlorite dismutase